MIGYERSLTGGSELAMNNRKLMRLDGKGLFIQITHHAGEYCGLSFLQGSFTIRLPSPSYFVILLKNNIFAPTG